MGAKKHNEIGLINGQRIKGDKMSQDQKSSGWESTGSRLDHLIEECSEVIKVASKIRRFGWDSYHPDDPEHTPNTKRLFNEMQDVEKRIMEMRQEMRIKSMMGGN